MLLPGTKIITKSRSRILKTLGPDWTCNGLSWLDTEMTKYTNTILTIKRQSGYAGAYEVEENLYGWIPEWFEVINETVLNDGSIEERSLCLALIRQTMSGNKSNLSKLNSCAPCFANKAQGGFNYFEFKNDCWFGIVAENIPNWPCIRLKAEILEEAIRNCLSQHGLNYFEELVDENINAWFKFTLTEQEDFWFYVAETLKTNSKNHKETSIEQPFKIKENEIKFQRKKGGVLRGTVPEGNQQSSGKCKTATCSGYLSHKICVGR